MILLIRTACGCSQLNSSEHVIPVVLTCEYVLYSQPVQLHFNLFYFISGVAQFSNQSVDASCQGQYTAIGCLAVAVVTSWLVSTVIIAVLCRKLTGRTQGMHMSHVLVISVTHYSLIGNGRSSV